jgi:hypothetical protein
MPAGLPPATRRLAWQIIAVASLVMLLLLTDGQPWHLFASGAFSSDFYDAQAESLTHGRLSVDPGVASIEGIVQGDETHLYYGILLALVRVPVMFVTDSLAGQLARVSILVAYVVALVLTVHLAHAAQLVVGREPDDERDRWRVGLLVAAVAVSPALFAFGWVSVYHETEVWALALALAALVGAVRLVATPARRWAYLAAGGSSLCTMTRASIGVAVTGATLVALVVAYRRSARQIAGPAVVALLGTAVHAAVNTARFGGPLALPAQDQVLTRINPARLQWFEEHGNSFFGAEFVPSTLWHYLRPDAIRFERVVPFVRFGPWASELNGAAFESNTPSTSLTVAATLLLVLAVVGAVWAIRTRRFAVVAMVVATASAAVPSLAIGFVANRYLIDFLPALALAAAFAVWLEPPRLPALRPLAIGLIVWGAAVNIVLGVWWTNAGEPSFIESRVRLDERLFGGVPPGVSRLGDVGESALFGTIVVDGDGDDCRGVYVVGRETWNSVERSVGPRLVEGTTRMADVALVDNPGWSLDLQAGGDVVFTADGAQRVLATVQADDGAPLEYTIVADPVTAEHYATVGDEFFYLPATVLDGPPLDTNVEPGPLCRFLDERLGNAEQ